MNARPKGKHETISNEAIQRIGQEYYKKFGFAQKLQLSIFQTHFGVADKLKNYSHQDARAKWLFLAETYAELGSHNNYIADQIKQLFHTHFPGERIKEFIKPEVISVQDLAKSFQALTNEHFYLQHHEAKYQYKASRKGR